MSVVTRLFVYSILLTNVLQIVLADDKKPEYKFILDNVIKNESDALNSNLTYEKRGTDVFVNGEVKLSVDLDNDYKVNMEFFHSDKPDGEYKKVMAMPEKGVCDICKSLYKTYLYPSLKNYANAPDPEKCPVMKEKYIVKDYRVDSSKFKKMLKPGYIRIVCNLLKDVAKINEYIVEGHVEEDTDKV